MFHLSLYERNRILCSHLLSMEAIYESNLVNIHVVSEGHCLRLLQKLHLIFIIKGSDRQSLKMQPTFAFHLPLLFSFYTSCGVKKKKMSTFPFELLCTQNNFRVTFFSHNSGFFFRPFLYFFHYFLFLSFFFCLLFFL